MLRLSVTHWPLLSLHQRKAPAAVVGSLALSVCILAGSTYYVFAKLLTVHLSPLSLFVLSELLTGVFVMLSFGFMPVLKTILRSSRRTMLSMILVGLCSGTLAPLLLFSGLERSSAVNASFFGNMEPAFMVVLAVLVLRERFGREQALSALAIVAGILVISLRGFTEGLDFRFGDLMMIAASFSFAVGSIIFRRELTRMEPHVVLFMRTAVALGCFFLISPILPHPLIEEVSAFPLASIPILIGFAFISRFLNVFSFYAALDRLRVTTVSLVINLGLITSVLFAWWMLGEPVAWYHVMGGALIVLGTLMLELTGVHSSPKHLERHLRQHHGHR